MQYAVIFLVSIFSLLAICSGDETTDTIELLLEMPACGRDCTFQAIPPSSCYSPTNLTCICTDPVFFRAMQGCITTRCDVFDTMASARLSDEVCRRPPRNRRADMLAVLAVQIPAVVAGFLRLYARWQTTTRFGADDSIMVIVMVVYVPLLCIGHYAESLAFGVDIWYVEPDDLTCGLKLFYVAQSLYLTTISLTKVSMILFFLRTFPYDWLRYACWVVLGWIASSFIIFVLLLVFQCLPIESVWSSWTGTYRLEYHCLGVHRLAFTAAGFSIAQEGVIFLLPMPVILRLNVGWRTKLGIVLMFSLGLFVMITSCIRLRTLVDFAHSPNMSWDYTDAIIWSSLETAISIIVVSLPSLRLLLKETWPGRFSTKASGASGGVLSGFGATTSEGAPMVRASSSVASWGFALNQSPALARTSRLFSMLGGKTRSGSGSGAVEDDAQVVETGESSTRVGTLSTRVRSGSTAVAGDHGESIGASLGLDLGVGMGVGLKRPPLGSSISITSEGNRRNTRVSSIPSEPASPGIMVETTTTTTTTAEFGTRRSWFEAEASRVLGL